MLVVPYETTPVSIVFGAEPWLFILKSDDHGRLFDILTVTLVEDERHNWPFVAVKALIGVHRLDDGEPAPIATGSLRRRQSCGHFERQGGSGRGPRRT